MLTTSQLFAFLACLEKAAVPQKLYCDLLRSSGKMLQVFDAVWWLEFSVRGDHGFSQQLLKYPHRRKRGGVKASSAFVWAERRCFPARCYLRSEWGAEVDDQRSHHWHRGTRELPAAWTSVFAQSVVVRSANRNGGQIVRCPPTSWEIQRKQARNLIMYEKVKKNSRFGSQLYYCLTLWLCTNHFPTFVLQISCVCSGDVNPLLVS